MRWVVLIAMSMTMSFNVLAGGDGPDTRCEMDSGKVVVVHLSTCPKGLKQVQ